MTMTPLEPEAFANSPTAIEQAALARETLSGKTVLITGGTGSFGNRVAQHLSSHNPSRVIVFSRDEKKQWEMRQRYPDYEYLIGDVRDIDRLEVALRHVDIVFHAAALKQVPACEDFPYEALLTNAVGSYNVCEASVRAGVRIVVALSTDKAVKPVNAMGMTKAIMEKIVVARNMRQDDTRFCCVRYGNVMGSRGSVIPLFRRQIEARRPLTITVPHMTRFLITLDEAVDLVVRAMTTCQGGEVFVRKAPASTVIDLARAMIAKFGAGQPTAIHATGIRPGEKIDEVLVNEYEILRATEESQYFVIQPPYRIAERSGPIGARYQPGYEYTSTNTRRITEPDDIGLLLDRMGELESYA